ncbi:MAG: transcriptional regulator, LuxR family, partial [Chthonomonadales bacterium]|nr:transcriptional regulator, LuxR family [Chthonomonadales bacterium]
SVGLKSLGEHRVRDLSRPEVIFQLLHPDLPAEFPPLKSLDPFSNNLPRQLTSFIGREKEIEVVKNLLTKTGLLTLTGSGGCGKTRLSLQVAADMLDQYPDGVWLVELAPLADPDVVPQEVASALKVSEQVGKTFLQTLTDHLKSRRLLLVLDNCEHLLSACAQLCNALLRACPHLTILASSREGLGISGELSYRVPSLSLPDLKQQVTPESVSRYEAVRLLIERALFHQPGFRVTNQNASALAAVCHRLDGIPLAIELAAARVRSLSVEEINARLDQRFRLLTGGSKTALPRQQTLRALIDWSYGLLTAQEKLLLGRLSVFAEGWTLGAAEQVCAGESNTGESIEDWEALDLLTSLSDKSLVVAETQGQTTRYRLLETVRQYGRERLVDGGEGEQIRIRHRDYFLAMAEDAEPHLAGAEQAHWLTLLEEEHDNLRQALAFCLEEAEGAEAGLRLGAALFRFWLMRNHLSEGRAHLAAVLGRDVKLEQPPARARALNGAGKLAIEQGDHGAASRSLQASLALFRERGDKQGIALCLKDLARVTMDQGDYHAARVLLEESLAISRELGDRHNIAYCLDYLGFVAYSQMDYDVARSLLEESLTIFRELGDKRSICRCFSNLGSLACDQGDYRAAAALLEENLALFRELGDLRGIASSLDLWASLAHRQQQEPRAARLWGAANRLREAIGLPRTPTEQQRYDQETARTRAALGESAFDAAFVEGRAMTWETAIEHALGDKR